MKKVIAYPFAISFYWIGHAVSLVMGWLDAKMNYEKDYEYDNFLWTTLMNMYSTFMYWSSTIDEWGNCEVWTRPPDNV
jgi:hypothetical protein